MGLWKDFAFLNLIFSDKKEDKLASDYLYALEEEKEQNELQDEEIDEFDEFDELDELDMLDNDLDDDF